MIITYKEVEKYLIDNGTDIKAAEQRIVSVFLGKKNNGELNIHSCTSRLKDAESVYLKIKRKQKADLKEVHDFVGVRILCLCEQDVFGVHKYIVNEFDPASELAEFTAFNWSDEKYYDVEDELRFDLIKKRTTGVKPKIERSVEGYKSLHYLVLVNNVYVEIQLRTVIQNVWAELGHSMAYKDGKASRHVVQDFRVIADHLEVIDGVISSVRDSKDKELVLAKERMKRLGPVQVFLHDSCGLKSEYQNDKYEQYVEHLKNRKKQSGVRLRDWIKEGNDLFEEVRAPIEAKDKDSMFWSSCEDAYWDFCEGRHSKALDKYNHIFHDNEYLENDCYKEMAYLIQYRIGEINFLEGRVTEAFMAFDECEKRIPKDCKSQFGNIYKVYNLLAYHYWRLGRFYSKQALEYMERAGAFAEGNTMVQVVNYRNSQTWYLLELYLNEQSKIENRANRDGADGNVHIAKLFQSYHELKGLVGELEQKDASSLNTNMFHTLACSGYELYQSFSNEQKEENQNYIDESHQYCMRCLDADNGNNAAFHLDHSAVLQRESLQEILNYCS